MNYSMGGNTVSVVSVRLFSLSVSAFIDDFKVSLPCLLSRFAGIACEDNNKMIYFRTFSKIVLGLINRKTPCHEAIMKVQPHWFNAKCDKRIKEVGGANAGSRQNTCPSFDRLILERKFRSILSTK